MIPPSLCIAAGIAVVSFGAAWQIQDWRQEAENGRRAAEYSQALVKQQEKNRDASAGYQKLIAALRTKTKIIVNEVNREVEKPVYRDCRLTDNGRMLLDSAIDTANSAR